MLKYSLAKTLATKKKVAISQVFKGLDISTEVTNAKGQKKVIKFYRNTNWRVDRGAFTDNPEVDLVRMSVRLWTRSKLGNSCCICNSENDVEMHHVRHIRKMTDKQAQGFNRVLVALNRKQIPVCHACHQEIHKGDYDGLGLKDLAYDPRKTIR